MQQLKEKIDKSREEIEEIQGEVKFFEETVRVKREQEPAAVARNEPLSIGSERSTTRSTSEEVKICSNDLMVSFDSWGGTVQKLACMYFHQGLQRPFEGGRAKKSGQDKKALGITVLPLLCFCTPS